MLFVFDQRNLKRTKYNTAITYKSSPSFLYILYSVHMVYQFSLTLFIDFFVQFFFKRQEWGGVWNSVIRHQGLCQWVHKGLFISTGQQLLLLICAGQRVAAVVSSHIQSGINWVGEVSGLEGRKMIHHIMFKTPKFSIMNIQCCAKVFSRSNFFIFCKTNVEQMLDLLCKHTWKCSITSFILQHTLNSLRQASSSCRTFKARFHTH